MSEETTVEIEYITPLGHDSVVIEVPESEVDEVFDELSDQMPAVWVNENDGR